ncbi:hypothetical protein P171DRAFT_222744 [Karstenula rhodostoma CBS 690.94]|uniref:WSC domain-containing protein n=1 Tax=Karstenula rhodostoma CBS 690.94 TaxID=1392251 RepID=A0A9P4PPN7_9PLEO|nr:hypothetical protein P171DRAFT_222744 [Karstenula rhodostoma CBS 690.94]
MYTASRAAFPGLASLLALYLLIATAMADWDYKYCSSQNTSPDDAFFWTWQSNGKCHDYCVEQGDFAFFVIQDKNCWCTNYIPAEQSDISDCSETCPGFDSENCGKAGQYYIYVNLNGNAAGTVGASQPSSSSSTSSTSASQKPTTTANNPPNSTPEVQTQYKTVTDPNGNGNVITQTLIITPTATAQPELSGKSKTNTGAIVGGVVGGRNGHDSETGDQSASGVHRYASTMSKAGLLRGEKQPEVPQPIATSYNRRHSRTLDQESISPISASDRRNSSFRIADQRLNPSTIFVFDNTSRASVGSLDDSRDYHRTLNVRNPDAQ